MRLCARKQVCFRYWILARSLLMLTSALPMFAINHSCVSGFRSERNHKYIISASTFHSYRYKAWTTETLQKRTIRFNEDWSNYLIEQLTRVSVHILKTKESIHCVHEVFSSVLRTKYTNKVCQFCSRTPCITLSTTYAPSCVKLSISYQRSVFLSNERHSVFVTEYPLINEVTFIEVSLYKQAPLLSPYRGG